MLADAESTWMCGLPLCGLGVLLGWLAVLCLRTARGTNGPADGAPRQRVPEGAAPHPPDARMAVATAFFVVLAMAACGVTVVSTFVLMLAWSQCSASPR